MFRVVPDQLKISDGWVRCGHCTDVFDATLYLETWAPAVPSAEGDGVAAAAPTAETTGPVQRRHDLDADADADADTPGSAAFSIAPSETRLQSVAEAPAVQGAETPRPAEPVGVVDAAVVLELPVSFWEPDPEPEPAQTPAAETPPETVHDARGMPVDTRSVAEADRWLAEPAPLLAHEERQAPDLMPGETRDARPETPVNEAVQEPDSDFQTELQQFAAGASGAAASVPLGAQTPNSGAKAASQIASTAPPSPSEALDPSDPEPGFVRQARRRAFWHSPGMRALLSVFALLLALVLMLQWALHERDALAAWQPRLAPALNQLCAPLGCEVTPVRRIDAIVIDSSALVRRLGNFYSFDLVLKNTAPVALAVPALELSLTDTRDAVIARRVFLPAELPGAPALLPAQDSVTISLRLSLAVGEAMPMAGYRALVFYP